VLNLEPLKDKWQAFGWEVLEIDGHDYEQIETALNHRVENKPVAIIAHTLKGKGVSEMEDKIEWHYRNIPDDVYQRAMEELNRIV